MAPETSPLLEVGRVVKPHGLRGEVNVKLITDRSERLAPGTVLHTEHRTLVVESSRPFQAGFLVVFTGIGDRDGAEALRGVTLSAPPLDDPETLWIHELIGAEVVDVDGGTHGRVVAVEANPASDLLVLASGALVPLVFVVDRSPAQVVIDPPAGLLD